LLQTTGPILLSEFLPTEIRGRTDTPQESSGRDNQPTLSAFVEDRLRAASESLYADAVAFMERVVLTRVLRHTRGNQSRAAKILGITRGSLRSKLRELRITIDQEVNVDGARNEPPLPVG
jgi:two-component system nitrogen regulation response regulator GlnG